MNDMREIHIKILIWLLFLSSIPLSVMSCKYKGQQSNAQGISDQKPVQVVVQPVQREDMAQIVLSKGTFSSDEKVLVSPKASGRIMEIVVDEGDRVGEGALLVRMDDTQLDLDVKRAEASVEELRARLDASKREAENAQFLITAAQAVINRNKAEKDLKQLEMERTGRLVNRKSMPQQKYDYAKSAYDVAVASVDSSKAELESAQSRLKEAEARLKTVEASLVKEEKLLEIARQRLQDTRITAPMSGVITKKLMTLGDMSDIGKPILVLEKIDILDLRVRVSSEYLQVIQAGLPVTIYPEGITSPLHTTITRVNPVVDPADRSIEVVCRVQNTDFTLKPGLFATIEITARVFKQAVVIPSSSIVEREKGQVVFIAENDHARRIPVLPVYEANEKSVIGKGLTGTEMLIIEGQKDLNGNEPLLIEKRS